MAIVQLVVQAVAFIWQAIVALFGVTRRKTLVGIFGDTGFKSFAMSSKIDMADGIDARFYSEYVDETLSAYKVNGR
jgi:hypothetical protein